MAFFKFRWPGKQEPQGDNGKPAKRSRTSQAESIEEMRRRARHRLIGATVLVLAGVVGFPLVFDSQPRPIPVDVAIDIPDRNKVAPLVVPQPAPSASPAPVESPSAGLDAGEEVVASRPRSLPATAPVRVAEPPAAKPEVKPEPKHEPRQETKPEPKPEPRQEAKQPPKPESKPEPRQEAKQPPKPESKPARMDDAERARALLEGRTVVAAAKPDAADGGRFIVQVGAFADADKAREVRDKLERSGLKTYTQVVDTKDGKRTRVRVGPFASRAEADKAADRVKSAGLAGTVLAL